MSNELDFGCYLTCINSLALCGGRHVYRIDGVVNAIALTTIECYNMRLFASRSSCND